jgi:hypothetical protein
VVTVAATPAAAVGAWRTAALCGHVEGAWQLMAGQARLDLAVGLVDALRGRERPSELLAVEMADLGPGWYMWDEMRPLVAERLRGHAEALVWPLELVDGPEGMVLAVAVDGGRLGVVETGRGWLVGVPPSVAAAGLALRRRVVEVRARLTPGMGPSLGR